MDRRLKLVITIIAALLLVALFFWATRSISNLTGHSITGTSVANPVGIDTTINSNDDVSVEEVTNEDSDGLQDNSGQG